ncbi:MAG: GyrI-like domain-containing protein [bacterium]|nr:GyrI-like domain-containing protein [bacterium]
MEKNIEPGIKTLEEKKLVGKRITISLINNKTGELWGGFMPRRKEITNTPGGIVYEISKKRIKRNLAIACLLLCTVIVPGLFAGKHDCSINVKINGSKARAINCEIAQAGTSPYILATVKTRGINWMIDLSGITRKGGKAAVSISVMKYRGRKMVGSYRARETVNVTETAGSGNNLAIVHSFTLKNRKGKTVSISGKFAWSKDAFPPEPAGGELTFQFGDHKITPSKITLQSWNQGFRLNKLFIVKAGETLNVTLDFPAKKPGTYKGKMTIMHFQMIKGKMKSRFLRSKNIQVKITKSGSGNVITFKGVVSGGGDTVTVSGSFF